MGELFREQKYIQNPSVGVIDPGNIFVPGKWAVLGVAGQQGNFTGLSGSNSLNVNNTDGEFILKPSSSIRRDDGIITLAADSGAVTLATGTYFVSAAVRVENNSFTTGDLAQAKAQAMVAFGFKIGTIYNFSDSRWLKYSKGATDDQAAGGNAADTSEWVNDIGRMQTQGIVFSNGSTQLQFVVRYSIQGDAGNLKFYGFMAYFHQQ